MSMRTIEYATEIFLFALIVHFIASHNYTITFVLIHDFARLFAQVFRRIKKHTVEYRVPSLFQC